MWFSAENPQWKDEVTWRNHMYIRTSQSESLFPVYITGNETGAEVKNLDNWCTIVENSQNETKIM